MDSIDRQINKLETILDTDTEGMDIEFYEIKRNQLQRSPKYALGKTGFIFNQFCFDDYKGIIENYEFFNYILTNTKLTKRPPKNDINIDFRESSQIHRRGLNNCDFLRSLYLLYYFKKGPFEKIEQVEEEHYNDLVMSTYRTVFRSELFKLKGLRNNTESLRENWFELELITYGALASHLYNPRERKFYILGGILALLVIPPLIFKKQIISFRKWMTGKEYSQNIKTQEEILYPTKQEYNQFFKE